ncbi:heparin lyase I family protein [Botryobacter ruber]|uniref:heparin lyase I family protein n=1 Tax=Botryobacter ruber TaxID=2171629 RepID=UPI000E0A1D3A|nr:heparin lyase I family protein [Botryobacter ruber]
MYKLFICIIVALLPVLQAAAQTPIISFGEVWYFLDDGSNQGTAWVAPDFTMSNNWKSGPGKFGYGITGTFTPVNYGPNEKKKFITTYFRKTITITNPGAFDFFTFNVLRDDGVVVYINGTEAFRNNMPTGTITYTTLATEAKDNGTVPQTFTIDKSAFANSADGKHVIAVEVHQQRANSPDLAFDLELIGNTNPPPPADEAPTVQSISYQSPATSLTNATAVTFRVTFSEAVTGVDAADFSVSGTAGGTLAPDAVAPAGSNGSTYDVTVSGINSSGTVRLDLKATGTNIQDIAGNAIAGGFTTGQTYTIDQAAPTATGIIRQSPTSPTTSATSVTFRVAFSEKVTGVDKNDFSVSTTGELSATLGNNAVAAVGTDGTTYDVTVSVNGGGILRLDLNATNTGIADAAGNAIAGGFTTGQTYTIEHASSAILEVKSITRYSPLEETTFSSSVTYLVTFSEPVTGVDRRDFTIAYLSGSASGSIGGNGVVATSTKDAYYVTISSISKSCTLRLLLNNSGTGITSLTTGKAISGGFTGGETYTIETPSTAPPAVVSINRQDPSTGYTYGTTLTYRVTFTEAVTGVDAADFTATPLSGNVSGILAGAIQPVSSSVYDVTVSSVSGDGMLRLDLKDSGTEIYDTGGSILSGGYTGGQAYSVLQSAAGTGVIYSEDMEGTAPFSSAHSLEVGDWPHAMQFVTSPVFRDAKAVRQEIRDTDPLVKDGYRSEVTIIKGENLPGIDMWYSFAAYFPSDGFAFDSERDMINQWYQDGSPATSLRIQNDRFLLEAGNESGKFDNRATTDLGEVTKDVWHTFVFHFIHSYGPDGLIEVWHNGTHILTRNGGNMYNNGILPKWKIGIYKSAFKYGTSLIHHRVLYYDNIRVGNKDSKFDYMYPSVPLGGISASQTATTEGSSTSMARISTSNTLASSITLYPTIVKRGASIIIEAATDEDLKAVVTDVSGREVLKKEFTGTANLETHELPSGVYFTRIWTTLHKLPVTDLKFIVLD